MRILIIGATGTIGSAVAAALRDKHELVLASYSKAPEARCVICHVLCLPSGLYNCRA